MKYDKRPISDLLRSSQTVFTFQDVALIWGDTNPKATIAGVNYYIRTGQLYRIRKGIYAKDKDYHHLELATKIYTPSYVSFETVLRQAGITFQYYSQTFVASYISREIVADGQGIIYKRIKDSILTNAAGVEAKGHYSIATPERAFLDSVYVYKRYHFDNLRPLNWDTVFTLLPIYGGNKSMEQRVERYHEEYVASNTQ